MGQAGHCYVFVGGLHRSGTSLVARLIAGLPGVAGIENAPVPENEGCYLQGAILHDAKCGAPMQFATDPAQHHTEASPYNSLETKLRLEADWSRWFAPDAPWRIEKSPVNLTRTRLYQQLFPLAQFVIVMRHPEIVAAAMAKWIDTPAETLIDHWLDAHEIVARDLDHLHSVLVVRYEDLVSQPAAEAARLASFLDRDRSAVSPLADIRDGNLEYPVRNLMTEKQAVRASRWGYAADGRFEFHYPRVARHPLRRIREAILS